MQEAIGIKRSVLSNAWKCLVLFRVVLLWINACSNMAFFSLLLQPEDGSLLSRACQCIPKDSRVPLDTQDKAELLSGKYALFLVSGFSYSKVSVSY